MVQMGMVTIVGYVGNDPALFGKGRSVLCSFRLGCTRGYYDAERVWHSFPTTWVTVKTFRRLAEHVHRSVRKGDPVIVAGQLNTEMWTQDNTERSRLVVEASSVGHDLNGGTAMFHKTERMSRGEQGMEGTEVRPVSQGVGVDPYAVSSVPPSGSAEPVRIDTSGAGGVTASAISEPRAGRPTGDQGTEPSESDMEGAGEPVPESDQDEFAGSAF